MRCTLLARKTETPPKKIIIKPFSKITKLTYHSGKNVSGAQFASLQSMHTTVRYIGKTTTRLVLGAQTPIKGLLLVQVVYERRETIGDRTKRREKIIKNSRIVLT